jgi:hypothetical protein
MKRRENAGNAETILMLEQGVGYSSVVYKKKEKKMTEIAKEEDMRDRPRTEAITDTTTEIMNAGTRDTTTKIGETKTKTAENIATQQCPQRMKTKIDQEDGMQIRG